MNNFQYDFTYMLAKSSGKNIPLDLGILLYRGGAKLNSKKVHSVINMGGVGESRLSRQPLLETIYEYLRGELVAGGSEATLRGRIRYLRDFYHFADSLDADPTLANVTDLYRQWVPVLYKRLASNSAFSEGSSVARTLSSSMGVNRAMFISGTPLRFSKGNKRVLGTLADKQLLADGFAFGADLADLISSLSYEACVGPLPVHINLRSLPEPIQHWLRLSPLDETKTLIQERPSPRDFLLSQERRRRVSEDSSLRSRYTFINLRVQAEFLLFISQTGMNPSQAAALTVGDYRFESWSAGYSVRKYKGRRKGEVEFEIFSKYRPFFENYLEFRLQVFGTSNEKLFLKCGQSGQEWSGHMGLRNLRSFFLQHNRKYLTARELRSTRVNWLLRQSDDPQVVASMGQHSVETMHRAYERPHHQRAVIEWTEFFQSLDNTVLSVAPGVCRETVPTSNTHLVNAVTEPDCINPSGCLFCIQYRGIDSLDFIWALLSFQFLKSTELTHYKLSRVVSEPNYLDEVLRRIAEVIDAFKKRGDQQGIWLEEAHCRLSEGDHHPRWAGFIVLSEALL